VLTLFEHIPRADLPFYVGLMDHLAPQRCAARCPCACPTGHARGSERQARGAS
jgi:hypothetical protein